MKTLESEVILSENEMALMESMDAPAAVVNYNGEIVYTNEKWLQSNNESRFFGEHINGENYFTICQKEASKGSDVALKSILGVRKSIDEQTPYQVSYSDDLSGRRLWFKASIHPLNNAGVLVRFTNESEKMETVAALRDTEERYRQQFNQALSGIIIGTPDGEITDANPAACKILGYAKEELIEGGRSLIVDDENPVNAEAKKVRNEKTFFEGEKVYRHSSGKDLTVKVSSVLYRNQDGELIAINTFRDISEEKEIKSKLDRQEMFNQATMNSMPGLFYVVDRELNYVHWNKAFETELGFTDEMVREIHPGDNVHPEDKELFSSGIGKVFKEGRAEVIARINSLKKGYRYYKLTGLRHETENDVYLVGSAVDVTEMVLSEKRLAESNRMMEQLFDNSPLGLVIVDEEGTVQRSNEGFEKMFGFNKQEVEGKYINKLITNDETLKEAEEISRKAFTGDVYQAEGVRYHKNGSEVPVLISSVPVNKEGEILSFYGIYVNLSEQKNLQNRIKSLLENEKETREKIESSLKEKEILLQEVHHRVKNNLALMAGLLDLQMMEEIDGDVIQKLRQVHGRIFSIAKIHETLYQEKNVSSIQMDQYLQSFIESYVQSQKMNGVEMPINVDAEPIELNLNQAVPMGLMLNELFNVLRIDMDDCKDPLMLNFNENNGVVELTLSGECLNICNLMANRNSGLFQFKLIEILLEQIGGNLETISDKRGIRVTFSKSNVKGSSSSFVQNLNL